MVAHAFNQRAQNAKSSRSLSWTPAQSGLHEENQYFKKKQRKKYIRKIIIMDTIY